MSFVARGRRQLALGPTTSATTPLVTGLTLIGSSGMAPFAVHVRANVLDAEGSTTGSGWWPEGRWQWQFVKSDGSSIDVADQNLMRVTDPISLASTRTDQRYGVAPNASFIFYSAGSYKVRCRYQNKLKEWSDWVESSTITVSTNTRTKRYVNGSTGNDSWDGTSPTFVSGSVGPKATLNGALSLVSGNDWDIEVADSTSCDVTASVNLNARTGVYIHRSGGGTAPVVVMKVSDPIKPGTDSILDGITFEYDGSTSYALLSFGANKTNLVFANVTLNEASSFAEISSAALPHGLMFFNCRTAEILGRYTIFVHDVECLTILGCTFDKGSVDEHTVRVSSGNGTSTGSGFSYFVSVDYSTLDHVDTGKTVFRCYGRHVGVYRSQLERGVISVGDIDNNTLEFQDYCFDGCRFYFAGSGVQHLEVFNNVVRVVVRSSLFYKSMYRASGVINLGNNSDGGARSISGLRFLNVSGHNVGSGNDGPLIYQTLTIPATDALVRGCMWYHDETEWTYAQRFYMGGAASADGWLFQDSVHTTYYREFLVGGDYTLAQANAEPWGDGLIEETHILDPDTGEPLGVGTGWKTAVDSSEGVFLSLNEEDMAVAGPAGCWREP